MKTPSEEAIGLALSEARAGAVESVVVVAITPDGLRKLFFAMDDGADVEIVSALEWAIDSMNGDMADGGEYRRLQ